MKALPAILFLAVIGGCAPLATREALEQKDHDKAAAWAQKTMDQWRAEIDTPEHMAELEANQKSIDESVARAKRWLAGHETPEEEVARNQRMADWQAQHQRDEQLTNICVTLTHSVADCLK